jgi:circadian clock protein KaiB
MSAGAPGERSKDAGRGVRKPLSCELRLFVAGNEANSALARTALERICSDHLRGNCRIEIIDVLKDSRSALEENILATPALIVRRGPVRTVIFGNLANVERVLAALEIGGESS